MNCMICNSNQVNIFRDYESPFIDKYYTLYACGNCESRFFDINQFPIDLEDIYEQHARKNENRYAAELRESSYWKTQVSRILGLCRQPVHSVLDIGCRTGDFLMHWPQGIVRCGVEISASLASVGVKRGLKIIQTPIEKAEFGQKFSVVTCYAIIEHLPDPVKLLQTLPRLVDTHGVVAILIPTWQCLKQKVIYLQGKQWHMYSPPQHLNFLSRKKLDETMAKHGFSLITRKYTSGGMFHPFRNIPVVRHAFSKLMALLDMYSPLNSLPVFDHMYSYYLREQ